jgi:hypothetical protein
VVQCFQRSFGRQCKVRRKKIIPFLRLTGKLQGAGVQIVDGHLLHLFTVAEDDFRERGNDI